MVLTDLEGNALMTDEQRREREVLLTKFMEKNKKKIIAWLKVNPTEKPPIFFDIAKKQFYWGQETRANRATRRTHEKSIKRSGLVKQSKSGSTESDTFTEETVKVGSESASVNASFFKRLKEKTRKFSKES